MTYLSGPETWKARFAQTTRETRPRELNTSFILGRKSIDDLLQNKGGTSDAQGIQHGIPL